MEKTLNPLATICILGGGSAHNKSIIADLSPEASEDYPAAVQTMPTRVSLSLGYPRQDLWSPYPLMSQILLQQAPASSSSCVGLHCPLGIATLQVIAREEEVEVWKAWSIVVHGSTATLTLLPLHTTQHYASLPSYLLLMPAPSCQPCNFAGNTPGRTLRNGKSTDQFLKRGCEKSLTLGGATWCQMHKAFSFP